MNLRSIWFNRGGTGKWIFLLGVFLGLFAQPGAAREVKVEEISLSLYNRPVTGFRVLLDRAPRVVKDQVIAHVSKTDQQPPFKFEQTLIFENIRYAPISGARELSLYYLIHDLEGQFTELTLVVMYDYRRSVNSRDFPALSLKVQADIARLVRRTTGDILKSDRLVFDDNTLTNLKSSLGNSSTSDPLVEHFQEEEVENNGVLLRGDPFNPSPADPGSDASPTLTESSGRPNDNTSTDPEVKRLKARILELELREKQLLSEKTRLEGDQVVWERKQELLSKKLEQSENAWDSVAILIRRVEEMMGYYYLADDFSVSSETASQMQILERNARRNEDQLRRIKLEKDSLQNRNLELQDLLAKTGTSARERAREIRQLEKDLRQLSKENEALKVDLQIAQVKGNEAPNSLDSLLGVLTSQKSRIQKAESDLAGAQLREDQLRTSLSEAQDQQDRLGKKIQELEAINQSLTQENSNLLTDLAEDKPGVNPNPALQDSIVRLRAQVKKLQANLGRPVAEPGLRDSLDQALRRLRLLETQNQASGDLASKNLELQQERDQLKGQVRQLNRSLNAARSQNKDSLNLLRNRVRSLEQSLSGETASQARIRELDEDLKLQQQTIRQLEGQVADEKQLLATAKQRESNLKKDLERAQKAGQAAQAQFKKLQEQQDISEREKQQLEAAIAGEKAKLRTAANTQAELQDSLGSLNDELILRQGNLRRLQGQIASENERSDSLRTALRSSENRNRSFLAQIDELETKVDSLEQAAIPTDDEGNFIREQWARLQEWEKELENRDAGLVDKEKLMGQREKYIADQDEALAAREEKVQGLEQKERELKALEQQLKSENQLVSATNDPGSFRVRDGRVMEFGTVVPVYIADTDLGFQAAQKRIVAYMLNRNELLDEQFPDLLFAGARLPELSGDPVDVRVRIDTRGSNGSTIQISFKSGDTYLGPESGKSLNEVTRQLVARMIRYRF